MRVITCPDKVWPPPGLEKPWVYLAGGITGCENWQSKAVAQLSKLQKGVLFNPRCSNFDPNAAKEQITWEYNALMNCHVFTIWFAAGSSDQPICMYELGRYLSRYQLGRLKKVVIGCDEEYSRQEDIHQQVVLADSSIHVFKSFEGYLTAIKETVEMY